jgi:glutamine phosphoribosylpyrophosphate amidotransferase
VEIHERFPNQEEEGLLFQHKTALVTMTEILRKRMSSVRERLMRRLDLKAKWRGSIGIGLVRYPREGPEPWNEERSKNRTSDEEQSPGDEYFP